jgi:hypothetical protein
MGESSVSREDRFDYGMSERSTSETSIVDRGTGREWEPVKFLAGICD